MKVFLISKYSLVIEYLVICGLIYHLIIMGLYGLQDLF